MLRNRSMLTVFTALFFVAPSAHALDVTWVDRIWLADSIDGAPITDPFGLEVAVEPRRARTSR